MRTSPLVLAALLGAASAKDDNSIPIPSLPIDKKELEQISLGLFEGALDEEHLEDVVECTTVDVPNAVEKIETAVTDIEQKSVSGVISGLDELAKAFTELSAGIKTCGSAKNKEQAEKILALVETFKNPETLALHVGHDILFNGVDIEKRINQAVVDYKAKDYIKFGQGLGAMLSEIAIGTEIQHQQLKMGEDDMNKAMIEQITLGLYEGALNEEHLEDVVECTTVDVPHAVGEIETAVKDIEQKSVSGIISGLDELAKAFGDMSSGLKTCANTKNKDQVEKIISLIETFKNPETLAIHIGHDILLNGTDIEKRIVQAIADFKGQNYLQFGKGLGAMLSEIAIGTEIQGTLKMGEDDAKKAMIEQIALGLFEGALDEEHLEDVVTCATVDVPHAVGEIETAIKDFEAGSVPQTIAGLDELATAFKDLSAGVQTCADPKNKAQAEKILTIVETFKNPETLAIHVGHDILFNGVDIEHRINKAVTDYKAQSWKDFGEGLGTMLSEIAIGTEIQQRFNESFLY